MYVDDSQVTFPWTRRESLKNKFLCAGYFGQSKVLCRRAHNDKIIVFCFVEGKKTSPLDASLALEYAEDVVQIAHCQHFADAGVMIQDVLWRICHSIEIAHSSLRTSNERSVAEDHPWFLRSDEERLPKYLKYSGRCFSNRDQHGLPGPASHHKANDGSHRADQQQREQNVNKYQFSYRLLLCKFILQSGPWQNRCASDGNFGRAWVERKRVAAFRQLYENRIVMADAAVIP